MLHSNILLYLLLLSFSLLSPFTPSEGPEYEYSGSEEEDDEVTEEEGEPR